MNNNNENIDLIDSLVKIFVLVDDIVKIIEQDQEKIKLIKKQNQI